MAGATTTGPLALACFCGTSPCPVYNWIGLVVHPAVHLYAGQKIGISEV